MLLTSLFPFSFFRIKGGKISDNKGFVERFRDAFYSLISKLNAVVLYATHFFVCTVLLMLFLLININNCMLKQLVQFRQKQKQQPAAMVRWEMVVAPSG